MKIYDITQELFTSVVYPGDVPPTYVRQMMIKEGDPCNVTILNMCAHNGTHVDAPYHFYDDGKTIDQIPLSKCIGECTVVNFAHSDVNKIETVLKTSAKKLLIKGISELSLETARLLNRYQIELVGVESQSVGALESPREVHLELLKNEVVLLEGIRLEEVPDGDYFLFAAPIKMGGSDGAPVRAVLLDKTLETLPVL